MMKKIYEIFDNALQAAGVSGDFAYSVPPKPEMGDFAFACFQIAKEQKKNPAEVAADVAAKIQGGLDKDGVIESVRAFGPYVNFFLRAGAIGEIVLSDIFHSKKKLGANISGEGKKVMIEYPSNNTHKEFHVGHLRNVCIGNTLVALYRKSGYKVVPVNYLNDFGAHVARCLWGLKKFHSGEKPPADKQKWLGDIYAEASRYVTEHPEAKGEIADTLKKLESHDEEIWSAYLETRNWSIEQFKKLFAELGVEHDNEFYEKDIKAEGQGIVDELLEKKIAEVGERGAIIINLEKYGLDIALVRKSDGTGLYLTSDLPLAKKKFKKYPKIDESITITGQEQDFYFRQLFKVLELYGFDKKMTHIGYGLINLPEGKMSSRTGRVILYETLRDEILTKMLEETRGRHADWDEKKVLQTARKLTMSALKFTIQKHESNKNITFDMKEATSFDGFSGPYILYVVARINSILRKAGRTKTSGVDFNLLNKLEEKRLVFMLAEYGEIVKKALTNYNPSVVAKYCFDLAQAFNGWYNNTRILDDEKTVATARLALALATKTVLEDALGVLTISTVEEM